MDLPIENSGIQSRISNSLHKISSVFDMLTFFIFQFLLLKKKGQKQAIIFCLHLDLKITSL